MCIEYTKIGVFCERKEYFLEAFDRVEEGDRQMNICIINSIEVPSNG